MANGQTANDTKKNCVSANVNYIRKNKTMGGRFKFVKVLGKGGFAQVIQVEREGEQLAVKLLLGEDIERDVSSWLEIGLGTMDHPNLLKHEPVFFTNASDWSTWLNKPEISIPQPSSNEGYITRRSPESLRLKVLAIPMPLASGSIASVLVDKNFIRTVSPDARLRWLFEIGCGLAFLWSKGIVHSDLKPDNVLLFPRCSSSNNSSVITPETHRAVISDFGMAGFFRSPFRLMGGTQSYMAPEMVCELFQVSASPVLDYSTDIFSYAVLVKDLLLGQTHYETPKSQWQDKQSEFFGEYLDVIGVPSTQWSSQYCPYHQSSPRSSDLRNESKCSERDIVTRLVDPSHKCGQKNKVRLLKGSNQGISSSQDDSMENHIIHLIANGISYYPERRTSAFKKWMGLLVQKFGECPDAKQIHREMSAQFKADVDRASQILLERVRRLSNSQKSQFESLIPKAKEIANSLMPVFKVDECQHKVTLAALSSLFSALAVLTPVVDSELRSEIFDVSKWNQLCETAGVRRCDMTQAIRKNFENLKLAL